MNPSDNQFSVHVPPSRRTLVAVAFIIFLLAFGVRLLSWHDTRPEVGKVQTAVTRDYKRVAELFLQGGIASFLSASSPLSDLNTLGHPPGYSILMALIFRVFGESNTAVQFVQIICDAIAAVVIFLIVAELFFLRTAFIAGMLAAFSPQFAWNSVLLLPDSLAVLPILLAVYCLARAIRKPRLAAFVVAGALVGISCWLRANAMLLTFFLALAVLLFERQRRTRYALAVVCGTLMIVLPLTIRNAVVFHHFIPISLGAGQTLLEGIADYDREGKFGIPGTDMGIMKQEAEDFHRPDYYGTLFNPDGVERERWRLRRGFAVIRAHPFWFSGVMIRRAASMLRLERSRLVSIDPPISHALDFTNNLQPIWMNTPAELLAGGVAAASQTKALLAPDGQTVDIAGDDSKYGEQFLSAPVSVRKNTDYVFNVPLKIEQGRIRVSVKGPSGRVYSSAIVETLETISPDEQPVNQIQLPLVATNDEQVRIVLSNEASNPPRPAVKVGTIKLFELGSAQFLWTRYPRFLVHLVQKVFLTAVMLPLAVIGLALLVVRRRWQALTILLVVPVYYFCVQSIVHTEYRYVLAVDYFLFALVAVSLSWIINLVRAGPINLMARKG